VRTLPTTPWHRNSFDEFLQHRLPFLLRERMGLTSVRVESTDDNTCCILVAGQSAGCGTGEPFEVAYADVPAPDREGVFRIKDKAFIEEVRHTRFGPAESDHPASAQRWAGEGNEFLVPPQADSEDLATARIDCVGEQLCSFVALRLGHLPEDVELDEVLVRRLLPLDGWVRSFLVQSAQFLNGNNGLDRATHLRRLLIPDRVDVFAPGHFGRTCPFETPEGPNVGRVLTISPGADIRDGRLIIVDDDPASGLGLGAASIPFLEHNDGNRVLMGANMMRQWLAPTQTEPPWVQTGLELEGADWCGRNLLTAFVSWDGDTYWDGLLISETAARKLACPDVLEPGDKLSNRHGTKGVVARVAADADMPRLPDGTVVELVYSLSGVPSRWTVGQLREAALSHVARRQGKPAMVPPFQAPSDDELHRQLHTGPGETGMMTLTDGGTPLRRPCTVGWVYWGCTIHVARDKLRTFVGPDGGQRVGPMEIQALREANVESLIQELTNTCSSERSDAASLPAQVMAGCIEPARTASPHFAELAGNLASIGIQAKADGTGVRFAEHISGAPTLVLVQPVPHPWLLDTELSQLHVPTSADGFAQVAVANTRLTNLLESGAPEMLAAESLQSLGEAVAELFDHLVSADKLGLGSWALFSGRGVLVPGPDLAADEVGLPADMAWTLFGPQVARALGDVSAVDRRTDTARQTLLATMESAWVVLNRAPSVSPTSFIAFRPVLSEDRAIRVPLLACKMLNADFDGDQSAVYLPLTQRAQQEVAEKLTVAGHLRRDQDLVEDLFPSQDALFGLACLSRSAAGLRQIEDVAGGLPSLDDNILTNRGVTLLLRESLSASEPEATLAMARSLMQLGFAASRCEGGSVGPFIGGSLQLPEPPEIDAADQCEAYMEELWAFVGGFRDYDDPDIGVICLLSQAGARATATQLSALIGPGGLVHDINGNLLFVRHCWRQGLTAQEVHARVVGARRGLYRAQQQMEALARDDVTHNHPTTFGVLSRARRCSRPGVVFARAARRQEVDPLVDHYARVFVGLPPWEE
jgi:hypothetical protein